VIALVQFSFCITILFSIQTKTLVPGQEKTTISDSSPLAGYLAILSKSSCRTIRYYYQSFDEMQKQYSGLHSHWLFLRHPQAVTAMYYWEWEGENQSCCILSLKSSSLSLLRC